MVGLSALRGVMLDEAGRLLDMGFAPEVKRLLGKCPTNRQTALLRAKRQGEVQDLARRFTKNAVQVGIEPERVNLAASEQIYIEGLDEDKVKALEELLKKYAIDQVLIFRHTKRGVDKLVESLQRRNHKVEALHGDLSQRERERTLDAFRDGSLPMLVATNVAARGLHIEDISHVVNYDLPEDPETFTHRVGRTGRAGKQGVAVTFVGPSDMDEVQVRRKKANVKFHRAPLDPHHT